MSGPSLYASVLHLDRRAIRALRVTDPYSLHRVVYSLYPEVRDEDEKHTDQPSGIVYVDKGGNQSTRQILMLADRKPASAAITENGEVGEVRTKPIPDGFLEHVRYQFQVVINPTRRDSSSRKLVPVKGRDDVAEWFKSRCQVSWGFYVTPALLEVEQMDVQQFNSKNGHTITLGRARIKGTLEVTDPARFALSFSRGIGRGRAFGCGLLQLVPLLESPFASHPHE